MSGFSGPPRGIVVTQRAAPANGATVTAGAGVRTLFLVPAATIATATVVLPAGPVEGQVFTVCSSQIITALTVTGTIIGTLTTLALAGFAEFTYSATDSAWFRTG